MFLHEPQYDRLGRYYELAYGSEGPDPDIPFYAQLAEERGGTVLEMGAGTGRVCTPIAARGLEVTGIELSTEMLKQAEQRAAQESLAMLAQSPLIESPDGPHANGDAEPSEAGPAS